MPHMDAFQSADGGIQFQIGSPATVVGGCAGGGSGSNGPSKKHMACTAIHHLTGVKEDTNVKMLTGAVLGLLGFFVVRWIMKNLIKVDLKIRRK